MGQSPEPGHRRSPGLCKMAEQLPERLARAESVLQPRAVVQLQSNANLRGAGAGHQSGRKAAGPVADPRPRLRAQVREPCPSGLPGSRGRVGSRPECCQRLPPRWKLPDSGPALHAATDEECAPPHPDSLRGPAPGMTATSVSGDVGLPPLSLCCVTGTPGDVCPEPAGERVSDTHQHRPRPHCGRLHP